MARIKYRAKTDQETRHAILRYFLMRDISKLVTAFNVYTALFVTIILNNLLIEELLVIDMTIKVISVYVTSIATIVLIMALYWYVKATFFNSASEEN